jgi:hypothetical protein
MKDKILEHYLQQNLKSFVIFSQYMQTNRICHGTRVDFVLENMNNQYSTEMLSPEVTDHMQGSHSLRRKFHG